MNSNQNRSEQQEHSQRRCRYCVHWEWEYTNMWAIDEGRCNLHCTYPDGPDPVCENFLRTWQSIKEKQDPKKEYEKMIKITPNYYDYAEPHYYLGLLLIELDRIQEAGKELEIALQIYKKQGILEGWMIEKIRDIKEPYNL